MNAEDFLNPVEEALTDVILSEEKLLEAAQSVEFDVEREENSDVMPLHELFSKEEQLKAFSFKIKEVSSHSVNWRYVVGTFEVRIPVTTRNVMLGPEENTLAVMKWRLQQMSTSNRWYPVMQRYVSYIAGRMHGLGGVSGSVAPSPAGAIPTIKPVEHTGKVVGIIYDRFGDFDGFLLWTEEGKEKRFKREENTESVVRFAWEKKVLISVLAEGVVGPLLPISIVLRRLPGHEEF